MVRAKFSAIKQAKPQEYFMRFLFGGAATVLAGLIATHFGPAFGGLFLAFPAIFPASVTLIEAHEKKRMAKTGHSGACRGRMAASIDASGAMLGSVGLAAFALVLWAWLQRFNAGLIMLAAIIVWVLASVTLWELRKFRIFGVRIRALR